MEKRENLHTLVISVFAIAVFSMAFLEAAREAEALHFFAALTVVGAAYGIYLSRRLYRGDEYAHLCAYPRTRFSSMKDTAYYMISRLTGVEPYMGFRGKMLLSSALGIFAGTLFFNAIGMVFWLFR